MLCLPTLTPFAGPLDLCKTAVLGWLGSICPQTSANGPRKARNIDMGLVGIGTGWLKQADGIVDTGMSHFRTSQVMVGMVGMVEMVGMVGMVGMVAMLCRTTAAKVLAVGRAPAKFDILHSRRLNFHQPCRVLVQVILGFAAWQFFLCFGGEGTQQRPLSYFEV